MSPTAFYCWLYERPFMWFGMKRRQPRPDQNFPLAATLLAPLLGIGLALLASALVSILANKPLSFFFWAASSFALLCAAFHAGFTVLAWNQRAARLRATGTAQPAARPPLWVRWGLGPTYVLLIGLVTPFAVFSVVENVRGALRWREVRTALVAKGEKLDIRELIGPPVPADQNFGSLPLFADMLNYGRKTNVVNGRVVISGIEWVNTNAMARFRVFHLPDVFLPKRAKNDQRPFSLDEWAAAFRLTHSNQTVAAQTGQRARAETLPQYPAAPTSADAATVVLTALDVAKGELASVCEASQRPYNRMPFHWEEGFNMLLPPLAQMKAIQRHLELRVQALLAQGQTDAAFAETLCALRVAELAREEPLLISQLVRIAQGTIAAQTIWHGIAAHRWSDAQLQELQRRVANADYFAGIILALEGERNGVIAVLDRWATNPQQLRQEVDALGLSDNGDIPQGIALQAGVLGLLPRGWIRQNQAALAEYHQLMIEGNRRLASTPPSAEWATLLRQADGSANNELIHAMVNPSPYNVLVGQLASALGRAIEKGVRGKVIAQCAATGCALERYRLKHGNYPESLTALVPEFLPAVPVDLMDGQPIRYARTDDGLFRLWSVGTDGKDDGGAKRSVRNSVDDWAWPR